MRSVFGFFIFNPVRAIVSTLVIGLLGFMGFSSVSIRIYPEVASTDLLLEIHCPGLAPDAVDSVIARVVDDPLASLPGLMKRVSECRNGSYRCFLTFTPTTNIIKATSDVRNKVDSLRADLPQDLRPPSVRSISKTDEQSPTMSIAVYDKTGTIVSSDELLSYPMLYKNQLESTDGVANVMIEGEHGSSKSKTVYISPSKMRAYGVSLAQCFHAIGTANFTKPAGECNLGAVAIPVTAKSNLETVSDIGGVIVANNKNGIVRIRDVAEVEDSTNKNEVRSTYNNLPCIHVHIYIKSTANMIEAGKALHEKLDLIRNMISNPNIVFEVYHDQTETMSESVHRVEHAIYEAMILVILVVIIFLGSARASVAVLLPLLICILSGFFIIWLFGFTINLMTLTALLLAAGIVVDDPIVVCEGIHARMKEYGETCLEAALKTVEEILPSIIGMTLTLASVYVPIVFISGMIGQMFKEFAITLTGVVIISGFLAFIFTPCVAVWAFKGQDNHTQIVHSEVAWDNLSFFGKSYQLIQNFGELFLRGFEYCENLYSGSLYFVLRRKFTFILAFGLFFTSTCLLVKYSLPTCISPSQDENFINFRIQMPSAKLDVNYTQFIITELEKVLKNAFPEIESIASSVYQGSPASINVKLIHASKRKKTASTLLSEMQEKMNFLLKERIVSTRTCYSPFMQEEGSTLYIGAVNMELLREYLLKITDALNKPGVFDVKPEIRYTSLDSEPGVSIVFNHEKAAKFGVSYESFRRLIDAIAGNPPATYLLAQSGGSGRPSVSMKLPIDKSSEAENLDIIRSLPIDTNRRNESGEPGSVLLGEIAEVVRSSEEAPANKRNGFFVSGISVIKTGLGANELYEKCHSIAEDVTRGIKGLTILPGEEAENFYKERSNLGFVFGLAIVFVYLFMAALFESFMQPLIVMFCVLPTASGVFLALQCLKDGSMNIWSMLGFLTLIGLMTRIGILMVMYFNIELKNLRERGGVGEKDLFEEAAVKSAKSRFKPIVMTTVIAVIDAVTLIFGKSSGYELFRQIGASLIGGLLIGTGITVYLIPILCIYFYKDNDVNNHELDTIP